MTENNKKIEELKFKKDKVTLIKYNGLLYQLVHPDSPGSKDLYSKYEAKE